MSACGIRIAVLASLLALIGAAPSSAAPPSLKLERNASGALRVVAPRDWPAYLVVARDERGTFLLPFPQDVPTFSAAGIPAPCVSVFYGKGARCPSDAPLEVDLGDQENYFNASLTLPPTTDDIYLLSILLSHNRETCPTTISTAASARTLSVHGGAGDETLIGSNGPDLIDSGDGRDLLIPGKGRDELHGGDGLDRVSYCERHVPVRVSSDDQPNDGEPSEGDNVGADIEDLEGGTAGDTLVGNAAANRLAGGAGDDLLDGGPNADALSGGSGNDRLLARDASVDLVDCGASEADAAVVDVNEVTVDCENVDRPAALDPDADRDGSVRPLDCNDLDPSIHPGAAEVSDDGIDEDCDGTDAINLDRDRDGVPRPVDCDDADAAVSPRAHEAPGNQGDEDCDGIAQPYPRAPTLVADGFAATQRSTRVVRMRLLNVLPRTLVVVTCRGHGCPHRRWQHRFRRRTATFDLRRASRLHSLQPGARLQIRITVPDAIGKALDYRFRAGALPRVSSACLDPLSGRSRRC